MDLKKGLIFLLLICLVIPLASCGGPPALPLPTLDAEAVNALGETCSETYNAQIDAWNSKDPESLRDIYTEDVVHHDGAPLFTSVDEVVSMAWNLVLYFPGWGMEAGPTYISNDLCLGTWINWGLMGIAEDNPAYEYDLITIRDGKISYWQLYYDQVFNEIFENPERNDIEFLTEFASTWSSGRLNNVMKMYSPDAEVYDTLFGYSVTGSDAIRDYFGSLIESSDRAEWTLLEAFAEDEVGPAYIEEYPFPAQGGVFALTVPDANGDSCEIRAALIITPNDEGLIISQQIFYQADTLIACGWAN